MGTALVWASFGHKIVGMGHLFSSVSFGSYEYCHIGLWVRPRPGVKRFGEVLMVEHRFVSLG